jgi:hypothetical protein
MRSASVAQNLLFTCPYRAVQLAMRLHGLRADVAALRAADHDPQLESLRLLGLPVGRLTLGLADVEWTVGPPRAPASGTTDRR